MIEQRLHDAEGLGRLIESLADQVASGRHCDAPLRLVGVRSRGEPIA